MLIYIKIFWIDQVHNFLSIQDWACLFSINLKMTDVSYFSSKHMSTHLTIYKNKHKILNKCNSNLHFHCCIQQVITHYAIYYFQKHTIKQIIKIRKHNMLIMLLYTVCISYRFLKY